MALNAIKLAQVLVARGDYAAVPEWQIAADLNERKHAARQRISGAAFKAAAVACRAWGALSASKEAAAINLVAMAEVGTSNDVEFAADLSDAMAASVISQAQRDALWSAGDTLISDAERDAIVARGEQVESGDVSRARPDSVVGTVYEGVHPETGATIAVRNKAASGALDRALVLKLAAARAPDDQKAGADADLAAANAEALALLSAVEAEVIRG